MTPPNETKRSNIEIYSVDNSEFSDQETFHANPKNKQKETLTNSKSHDKILKNNFSLKKTGRKSLNKKHRKNFSLNLGTVSRKMTMDLSNGNSLQNIDEEEIDWRPGSGSKEKDTISTRKLMRDLKEVDGLVRKSLGEVRNSLLRRSKSANLEVTFGKGFAFQPLDALIFQGYIFFSVKFFVSLKLQIIV